MSVQLMTRVFSRQFAPTEKLVALKLADVAQDDGTSIFPSVETISTQTGLSVRAVRNVLKAFRERGLLKVVRNGGGRNLSTRYRMDVSVLDRTPEAFSSSHGGEEVKSQDRENPAPDAPFSTGNPAPRAVNPAPGAPNPSLSINSTPYGENSSASDEAGANPPSTNAEIWKEALALLQTTTLPEAQCRNLIGKWCKRAASEESKIKLLAIVRAAAHAGTGDPVSYITKAVDKQWPPPPDPRQLTRERWLFNIQAAIKCGEWAPEWGPPPGKPGCHLPRDLHSPSLLNAVSQRKKAA